MDPVHARVDGFLRENGISRAAPILVAVSGGPDSVALLHLLVALGQRVGAAHVQHGLRGEEAEGDLRFAAGLARERGVCFAFARVDARVPDGRSPEERARELRYRALEEIRGRDGYAHLATAHTLDDQAETVLLRAIRGSGLSGLAAIVPRSLERGLLRPLLGVRRAELRNYLRVRGLSWREDSTNSNLAVPRNRLRAEVLPVLEAIHPGAARKLAELAGAAREERLWLEREVEAKLAGAVRMGDGGLWLDRRTFAELPPALRARALAYVLERAGLGRKVTRAHLARVDRFLGERATGKTLSLPEGSTLFSDGGELWLGPHPEPHFPAPFRRELSPPDALELAERGARLVWRRLPREGLAAPRGVRISEDLASGLAARSPLPGDRIEIRGRGRERSLKDLFAGARWSRRERARAVVVEARSRVLWVVGLASVPELGQRRGEGWELSCEPFGDVGELLEFDETARG